MLYATTLGRRGLQAGSGSDGGRRFNPARGTRYFYPGGGPWWYGSDWILWTYEGPCPDGGPPQRGGDRRLYCPVA